MIEILEAAIKQLRETHKSAPTSICIGYGDARQMFEELTSHPKWYHGVNIDRHHASRIMKKHKAGTYTNYKWILSKFGFCSLEIIHKMK